MSKVKKPDGKYRAPDGRTILVQNGEASYVDEGAGLQEQPQQPQLGDDGYKDNYTGLAGSVRSYADAATGGLPTYANAGIGALYDVLKDRFGDKPTGKEFGDAWNQNFEMEQRRAQSAASQHIMDAVAGGLLSPANLVPGLPIAAGASYAHALGGNPWVGAAVGAIPTAVQGVKAVAPAVVKNVPAIAKRFDWVQKVLGGLEDARGPKPLPQTPRRPPSMRGPQKPMPEAPPVEPTVDPRIRGRVENLPGNAVDTAVDAAPAIPPEVPVMPEAPPRMQPNPRPNIDPRTSPVGTGKPSWPGAETGSMRAVVPEAPVAPVARGPVRSEFQAPKGDWLDELRTSLKSQWGEGKNVAKVMESPEARIRARGEKP